MAGVEKTPENAWDDEDYYYILCEISRLSYDTDDISELADYMQKLFREYMQIQIGHEICMETARKLLQNV